MEALKAKAERMIVRAFLSAQVELEYIPQSDKLSGHVIASKFSGKSQNECGTLLWELLRHNPTQEQQQHLSIILTLSPAENGALVAYS